MPAAPAPVTVRVRTPDDDAFVISTLVRPWGAVTVVSRLRSHDASRLPALIAELEGEPVGLLTYHRRGEQPEIPIVSEGGTPIRDEWEIELPLGRDPAA